MANRHLFLDLCEVTRMERLYREMHQPIKHPENPILRGEHPWETIASLYGTVLYIEPEKLFKMWYLTGPYAQEMVQVRRRKVLGNITLLGYVTSTDGIHWEKPILNQVDFEGSTENNLVHLGRTNCEGIAVLYDERDPDSGRRYKGFYWEHGGENVLVTGSDGRLQWGEGEDDGMWLSYSPDGVHWTNYEKNPVIAEGSDTTQSLVWDPGIGKYVGFGRFGAGGRKIARAESADCMHFSKPELVFQCDEIDEEDTQFYGMPVNIYEGIYLGMAWIYREGVDGTIDTSLATSRDGIHWERTLDRQTFLPLGPAGSWEDGMTRISQNFLAVGDKIYLYYGGVQGPHAGKKFARVERLDKPMVGLATIRRDGFVSLDAGDEDGYVLTKPLTLPRGELHINVDSRGGYVVAAVTDGEGKSLDGYAASDPVSEDSLDHTVRFKRSLRELLGREVRLSFHLKRASLYSYWFA